MKSAVFASMVASAGAAHWAVIMAGSNTYGNYRHQTDACHAYQIAKKNGIPESNIILLAYDDIANSSRNPFPGKMFNKPTAAGTPGKDVYEGCKINYKGSQVTAANFIKVLSGDTSAPGPVLKSTASDRVFVYYTDHGGVGILGVPSGAAGGYIHAADINKAIETLQSKGGYKELLFYLEACESGSIFANLLKAPNAKAVTAANPSESSWGWYCAGSGSGGDMVDGKSIGSCLGDEFSVRWMEDTDSASITSETVGQQFSKVQTAVTKSHVQQYGTTSFDSEPIGNFEGSDGALSAVEATPAMEGNGVDSRQVEVHQAYYRVMRAKTAAERKEAEGELEAILARRHSADAKFGAIASIAMKGDAAKAEEMLEGNAGTLENASCHRTALETAAKHCGAFNDYSLRYSRLFANLCTNGLDDQTIASAIEGGCGQALAESDCETEYKKFKAAFPEKASSPERSAIFCSNLARIEKHNAANARWTMGLNKFSDWTDEEVSALLGATDADRPELPLFEAPADLVVKPLIDWRSKMPAVKNQESCGSCWAFSAIDVVDFYGGSHSEQQLLDCSGGSCNGYNSQSALQYLTSAGSDTESQYPYSARQGSCRAQTASTRVSNVRSLSGASSIQSALQSHVVSVSFQLSEQGSPFMNYGGGVYDSPCGSGAGHAVGAVGYSGDYWIIRNSWGSGWGVGGYVYFKKGEDLCRLESWMPVTAQASGAVVV